MMDHRIDTHEDDELEAKSAGTLIMDQKPVEQSKYPVECRNSRKGVRSRINNSEVAETPNVQRINVYKATFDDSNTYANYVFN